jgi:hypothetical protein
MNPRDLSAQAASLRHILPLAQTEEIRACVEQALQTIEWLQRREELIKMLEQTRLDKPHLYDLLVYLSRTFPGASIEDIRATEQFAEDTGL